MNDSHLHELLSAHLDGEVTGAERAEVEAWLDSSEDARAERRELEAVGEAVRGLPPESVDLRDDVLAAIAPATGVVPADDGTTPPRTAPAPSRTRSPAGPFAAVAGVVVSLACTIVVALSLGPSPETEHPADGFAVRGAPTGVPSVAESRGARFRSRLDRDDSDDDRTTVAEAGGSLLPGTDSRADADDLRRALAANMDPKGADFAEGAVPRAAAPMNEPADAPGEKPDFNNEAPRLYVFRDADLRRRGNRRYVDPVEASADSLRVGDVLPFVDRSGERVAVVEVTVVDVQRAFGEVQLLLQRNAIRELSVTEANAFGPTGGRTNGAKDEEDLPGEAAPARAPRVGESKREQATARSIPARVIDELEKRRRALGVAADREGDTFAVYVSSSPARIASTLRALERHELVVALDRTKKEAAQNTATGVQPAQLDAEAPVDDAARPPGDPVVERDVVDGFGPSAIRDTYQVLRKYRAVATRRKLDELRRDEVLAKSAERMSREVEGATRASGGAADRQVTKVLILLRRADR